MAIEIERKFLLKNDSWRNKTQPVFISQGYLHIAKDLVIRVRTVADKSFLSLKGTAGGIRRLEFEYRIPMSDAVQLLEKFSIKPPIEKNRYYIEVSGFKWEIDEFLGVNTGLILAEIELKHERQQFPIPEWLGAEVTGDIRYYNAYLAKNPYQNWSPK